MICNTLSVSMIRLPSLTFIHAFWHILISRFTQERISGASLKEDGVSFFDGSIILFIYKFLVISDAFLSVLILLDSIVKSTFSLNQRNVIWYILVLKEIFYNWYRRIFYLLLLSLKLGWPISFYIRLIFSERVQPVSTMVVARRKSHLVEIFIPLFLNLIFNSFQEGDLTESWIWLFNVHSVILRSLTLIQFISSTLVVIHFLVPSLL